MTGKVLDRMGKRVDLEKLRSIGHTGKLAGKRRVRRLDGPGESYEIDAPDGSKAAVVRPSTVVGPSVSVKEVSGG